MRAEWHLSVPLFIREKNSDVFTEFSSTGLFTENRSCIQCVHLFLKKKVCCRCINECLYFCLESIAEVSKSWCCYVTVTLVITNLLGQEEFSIFLSLSNIFPCCKMPKGNTDYNLFHTSFLIKYLKVRL